MILVLKGKCLACNEEGNTDYFLLEYKVIVCHKCKAIYTENPFEDNSCYNENDTIPSLSQRIRTKIVDNYISQLNADQYLRYLQSKTDMNFENALDIGAGYGTFVTTLQKKGINTDGIESNLKIIKLVRTEKIRWEHFDQNYVSKKKYDLICLNQMISFLRDNCAVLQSVKNMLTPKGIIFIVTPNPESSILKETLSGRLSYANMIFSKKNFESLSKIGLKMIDYSIYRSNLGIDFQKSKNTKISFLRYFLKIRKAYESDPNGQLAFILLKPIE